MNFAYHFARKTPAAARFVFVLLGLTTLIAQTAAAQSVFINEIHYDNTGTDAGEAIEIAGPAGTDLTGWSLVLYNGSGGALYNTISLSGVITNQQGGFGTQVSNLPVNGLQNGSPDGIALVDAGSSLVQFISYEGSFIGVGGPAAGIASTDIGVSENGSGPIGESLQLTGTGTTYGDFSWTASSPSSFGSANTGQVFGDGEPPGPALVINEIDYDQPSTDTAEFIEILNNGVSPVDLAGWSLALINGNGGTLYATIDLAGGVLAGGDYLVVCANAATVANCDIDASPDTNLIQNGAPDAVALLLDGVVMDAVSYEGDTVAPYTEGSGAGLDDSTDGSISRCPDGVDTDQNNLDLEFVAVSTPGDENSCNGAREVKIHEIQGNGAASPLVGAVVIIRGIVVGDFQDGAAGANGDLNGFHVQEEDADADTDPLTSEGIFVFNGNAPALNVQIGDLVRVEGVVSEFNGLTEITSFTGVSVLSSGNPLPAASVLSLPVTAVADFEAYEGMLVTFPQSLVISEYFNFDRFNEIVLSSARHLTPTAEFEPGPDAVAAANAFLLDSITLDDGRSAQNPDPAMHPNGAVFDLGNLFRGGDTVANVTGVMDYSFNLYRIQPTAGANYASNNPRTASPDEVGGSIRLVSFNTLNYFSTLDNAGAICGPSQNQDCRGADNAEEFARQRAKTIAALTVMDAAVVGLLEIENNINDDAVTDLVAGLNAATAPGKYDYVATGAIGSDAIKVALLYQPEAVSLVGGYAILDASVDGRFDDARNRPSLAQTFIDNTTGGIFTVAVNHLKSKGSDCNDAGDPDTGDGSGNCNLTRKAAAEALVDWLASDPTGSGDADVILIGDFNSYDKEEPIDVLLAGGYTDLIDAYRGEDAYSFVFGGQIGYLDYALANANLMSQVTGATEWHINADEPDLLDYDTTFKGPNQDAIYAPDAYRSGDHDPIVVGLETCDEIAPTIDAISLTPNVLWPANHKYVDVAATVSASDNFDPDVSVTLVSVTSNEADNGNGDGNTADDIMIVDDFNLSLRAERSGAGTGRIYTVTYLATDDCGNNSETASATVTVPHSEGN